MITDQIKKAVVRAEKQPLALQFIYLKAAIEQILDDIPAAELIAEVHPSCPIEVPPSTTIIHKACPHVAGEIEAVATVPEDVDGRSVIYLIKQIFKTNQDGSFTPHEIEGLLPQITMPTIRSTLSRLVRANFLSHTITSTGKQAYKLIHDARLWINTGSNGIRNDH
jgi:DNA-binding HxlR family transcriptional regulator